MVDTDALPHVVHLISVKLEGAQRTQTSVNTEQLSKLVLHIKTFQKYIFLTQIGFFPLKHVLKLKYEGTVFIRFVSTAKLIMVKIPKSCQH